jgi:hypothetical protein
MKRLSLRMVGMTVGVTMGLMLAGSALAKLPAPTEEQKAKAAAEKEKTAWSDKVAAFQLCKVQDKVAATYRKNTPQAKPESAVIATPACTDPGPFQAAQAAANVGNADSRPVPQVGAPAAPPAK